MRILKRMLAPLRRALKQRRKWRDTEVFLVSFPKCGRTWLRMLIGQMVMSHLGTESEDPTNLFRLTNRERSVHTIGLTHDRERDSEGAMRTEWRKGRYAGRKVILLVRDPRDVVVSLYFHQYYRSRRFSGALSEFIRTEPGGFDTILHYYNAWAQNRHVPQDFLLVTYEGLHERPTDTLWSIGEFVGIGNLSDETIEHAIERSSFDAMRGIEQRGEIRSKRMQAGDESDTRSFKTRSGKPGAYVEHMNKSDLEFVDERVRSYLDDFYAFYK